MVAPGVSAAYPARHSGHPDGQRHHRCRAGAARGRYSTPLPSTVAEASTWDLDLACEYGALIGRELRNQGYTMSLGGGVNLAREPRNGRTFEYKGEDPILAGKLVAREMKCLQANGIMGDIKHFAVNDQETGRRSATPLWTSASCGRPICWLSKSR